MMLRGRTALVTGASSGIGAATATALAARGCRLLLVGRDEARLAAVARRTGGATVVADLTSRQGLRRAVEAGRSTELLVNNAGIGWAGELRAMPPETVAELLETNLSAPVQLTRQLLPDMLGKRCGHIVFVSSIAAVGVRDEAVYAAGKAGLRTFADSVRQEVEGSGIGVTTILPGVVRTPFFARRGDDHERRFPRPVAPETVAGALVDGIERNRLEVFVPRWLDVAARVRAAAPRTFHRLARRFG